MKTTSKKSKLIMKRRDESIEPNVNDAIRVAINYLRRVLDVKNVLVEEIDQTTDGKYWLITLSHENLSKGKKKRTLSDLITIPLDRSYKIIKIDKQIGMILSMKIREI